MSLWVCLDCTTAFSVGAPRCPHCGSERHAEEHEAAALGIQHGVPVDIEEDDMPKITRHEGASVADVVGDEAPVAEEGGEDVSAGEDSSTSSEKPSTKPEASEPGTPKRARKTASRSVKGQGGTQGSSAGSADGGPEAGTSETDGSDA